MADHYEREDHYRRPPPPGPHGGGQRYYLYDNELRRPPPGPYYHRGGPPPPHFRFPPRPHPSYYDRPPPRSYRDSYRDGDDRGRPYDRDRERGYHSDSSRSKPYSRDRDREKRRAASASDDEHQQPHSTTSEKEKEKPHEPVIDEEDLSIDLHPLTYFVGTKPKLLAEAVQILKGKRLEAMTPPSLKKLPLKKLESACLTELEMMDKATILNVIDGKITSVSKKAANIRSDRMEEVVSSVIPAKNLKQKVKKSLTAEIVAKRVKRLKSKEKPKTSSESEESESEAKAAKKAKKKKAKKKKKKAKAAAEATKAAQQPVQFTGRTLMELLELEYRAKAIKALLKKQDVDPSQALDEALSLKSPTPSQLGDQEEEVAVDTIEENTKEDMADKVEAMMSGILQEADEQMKEADAEEEEEEEEVPLAAHESEEEKVPGTEGEDPSPLADQNAISANEEKKKTRNLRQRDATDEELDYELEIELDIPEPAAESPMPNQNESEAESEQEREPSDPEEGELDEFDRIKNREELFDKIESGNESSGAEDRIQEDKADQDEDKTDKSLAPGSTHDKYEKIESPSSHGESSQEGAVGVVEFDEMEVEGAEGKRETESSRSDSEEDSSEDEAAPSTSKSRRKSKLPPEEDEETPLTWYHRWYNSKKIQSVVKTNRVLGKLRSKLRQEKAFEEERAAAAKLPMKDESDADAVPIIGSIEEYESIFGKQVPPPVYERDLPKPPLPPLPPEEELEEEEEEGNEDLWGDIMGAGAGT